MDFSFTLVVEACQDGEEGFKGIKRERTVGGDKAGILWTMREERKESGGPRVGVRGNSRGKTKIPMPEPSV